MGPEAGPTFGKYHICSHRGKVPGLTAGGSSGVCSLSDWTRARLNQGKARLGQGMTMDWSGDGRWHGHARGRAS